MKFWQKPAQAIRNVFQYGSTPARTSIELFSTALNRDVRLDICTPPDYERNRNREYPLVLFNDG
ncbi:MAG: hypothetical protein ACKO4W_09670, partial [Bacteroidota bacterium]